MKTHVPLRDVLLSMPANDLWEDAEVLKCLDYVLGSKRLVIPREYQDVYETLFSLRRP